MNKWSNLTLRLIDRENYLDQLQEIYSHEEGERTVDDAVIEPIRAAFIAKNKEALMNELLNLERFPYKDSYVGFLRKDRTAIQRNPETVKRICERLYDMGIENVIAGVKQSKEANTRRGYQFTAWLKANFKYVNETEFKSSKRGVVILEANELDARDFCNKELNLGVSKRPDLVCKSDKNYVVGEAKFLSTLGGNQGRAFDDGMHLANNASGRAHKVFILDGMIWIEKGSAQFRSIENSQSSILSVLLLTKFLRKAK